MNRHTLVFHLLMELIAKAAKVGKFRQLWFFILPSFGFLVSIERSLQTMPLKSCNYRIEQGGQMTHVFRFENGYRVALNSEMAFEFAMKLMDNELAKLSQFKKSGLSMKALTKWAALAQCA